ncbi:hypothetical protein WJ0W_006013 [Paenibacillus melissococcoides]|uniref:Uncharacterized protein n=1 Tax=Paenibacillus melissococcoides TaxID=2912268 RepID=A0ABM9GAQ9_9BACL|nr:hypothetical protein WJ0W_006013 [Paenibacillus melissococcoides]
MSQAIQTLGAAATSANVPLEEQLAIVGMLQATMSGLRREQNIKRSSAQQRRRVKSLD